MGIWGIVDTTILLTRHDGGWILGIKIQENRCRCGVLMAGSLVVWESWGVYEDIGFICRSFWNDERDLLPRWCWLEDICGD